MTATVLRPVAVEPPLITRLVEQLGATRLDDSSFEAFIAATGHTVLFFTEDPLRIKETLDVAVILPEIAGAVSQRLRADYVAATNEVLAGPVRPLPPKVMPVAAAGAASCG
jgi:hypothetical protein